MRDAVRDRLLAVRRSSFPKVSKLQIVSIPLFMQMMIFCLCLLHGGCFFGTTWLNRFEMMCEKSNEDFVNNMAESLRN